MIGIELVLPVQAIFFSFSMGPPTVSPYISSLQGLRFCNGFNELYAFDYLKNMKNVWVGKIGYWNEFILNYNYMFCIQFIMLLALAISYTIKRFYEKK
jgi:hypothetical protein